MPSYPTWDLTPLITSSRMATNGDTYTDNCLAKNGKISSVPEITRFIFKPDLSGAHYLNKAVQFLNYQNIEFVPKSENPPTTSEIRCIEDFWGLIK